MYTTNGVCNLRLSVEFLSLDGLPDAVSDGDLYKPLDQVVNVVSDPGREVVLHTVHQEG